MRILLLTILCLIPAWSDHWLLPAATDPAIGASQSATDRVPVPEPSEKAMRYYRSGVVLWIVGLIWGFLVPIFFLFTGLSARIRNIAQRLGKKTFFIIGIYFLIFLGLQFVINLPLSYYVEFQREHDYGLSNQTFQKWMGDSLKALAVGGIMGFAFLWIPYLLLKKSPQHWWLYTSLLAVPFLILVILVAPIWIDPLFNDFGPMKNKALEEKILNLAEKAGIEESRVFEVNKSEDTKSLNAYVTGFGGTKRIVLWDTIIERLTEEELLFVMGHEMGHYALGHVWKTILFFSVLILVTLYTIHRTAGWLIARFRNRFGFDRLSDVASLPLILLLFGFYGFLMTPPGLAFSRYQEHESDRFGLEITQNNRAAAKSFVKLQTENLSNPRRGMLMKILRSSHPPLGERIDFSNEYRPWEKNEPLRYGHLFKK